MATVNTTSAASRRGLPAGKAPSPIIARTDGQCLILKGVRFNDGKRYDVRIWRLDDAGDEIALRDQMEFSAYALAQIQEIAKNIFQDLDDPTESKIIYRRDGPESCENHTSTCIEDLIKKSNYGDQHAAQIVNRARRIHELLFPVRRMDHFLDPRDKLVIKPQFLSPKEINALYGIKEETTPVTPPPITKLATPITPDTSTQQVKEQEQKNLLEMGKAALNKPYNEAKANSFLEGITYDAFKNYAQKTDKGNDDNLRRAYEAYKEVLIDPTLTKSSDDKWQMKEWLKWLYLNACDVRKEQPAFNEYFEKYEKAEWANKGGFEEWCRYHAANSVTIQILAAIESKSLNNELMNPPSINISTDDD